MLFAGLDGNSKDEKIPSSYLSRTALKRNKKITRLSTFLCCLHSRFGIINQLTKKYLSPYIYPVNRDALLNYTISTRIYTSSPTSTVTSSLKKVYSLRPCARNKLSIPFHLKKKFFSKHCFLH